MKVKTYREAFEIAVNELGANYHFSLDREATERAGYKIYRAEEDYYEYFCDLNTRIEYNSHDGKSVNIWIETEEEKEERRINEEVKRFRTAKAAAEIVGNQQSPISARKTMLCTVFIQGYSFSGETERTLYNLLNGNINDDSYILFELAESYCNHNGIKWKGLRHFSLTKHTNSNSDGHYVYEFIAEI